MFILENDTVLLSRCRSSVCHVEDIDRAIQELQLLRQNLSSGTNVEVDEDRYTAEGIDRYFRASEGFNPSRDFWSEDSPKNWEDVPGPELFNRYQKHAECYCSGCVEYGIEPSYEGFRQWLIKLRDMGGVDE